MMDNRSKYFVFVPFCLLAQSYQALGIVRYEWKSSIKPFVELLIKNDINIIQIPCIESTYLGLNREPMGLSKYNTVEFNQHCDKLSNQIAEEIENLSNNNYKVLAILGIEQSPSCCVNYIYTNKGMEKRSGLFMEKLQVKIKDKNIPFIGINRKYINKSLKELEKIINDVKNH